MLIDFVFGIVIGAGLQPCFLVFKVQADELRKAVCSVCGALCFADDNVGADVLFIGFFGFALGGETRQALVFSAPSIISRQRTDQRPDSLFS